MPDIRQKRLHDQHITRTGIESPEELVRWLTAVQSQDYNGAVWALGLRLPGMTEAAIDQAFADGKILRTHVLRPTWHFVTPDDIGWMLKLTAPRVLALSAYYYRQFELDDAVFARTDAILAKALKEDKLLRKIDLVAVLQQNGFTGDDLRFAHMIMHAELEGVICSGPRKGKHFTYMLLSERAPNARVLARDEALAELARRYFVSHGPATLKDYTWWSGLSAVDARAGLEMVKSVLNHEDIDGETYWFAESSMSAENAAPVVHLLPNYDEYMVAFTDRSAAFDPAVQIQLDARGNILFSHILVIDGHIAGTWKRTLKKNDVVIELTLFRDLNDAERAAVQMAADRYGEFVGRKAVLS